MYANMASKRLITYESIVGFYSWVDVLIKGGIKNNVEKGFNEWFKIDKNNDISIDPVFVYNCIPKFVVNGEVIKTFCIFLDHATIDKDFHKKMKSIMDDSILLDFEELNILVESFRSQLALEYVRNNSKRYVEYWKELTTI